MKILIPAPRAIHTAIEDLTIVGLDAYVSAHSSVVTATVLRHDELHDIPSHPDTDATGAEVDEITDGSTTTLHTHEIDTLDGGGID